MFVVEAKVPATVLVEPMRVVALKLTIIDPPLRFTTTLYACKGLYALGNPDTVIVPPVPPWHEDAQEDLPGAPEYPPV